MTSIPDDLALFTLPGDYCPGTDLMSKILLKDARLMEIIIKEVVGNHASSESYTLGRCKWANKTVSDVFYLPSNANLPPVLVEIQHKVDDHFLRRAIKYCISLEEEYGVQPIMLIFSIKGFANERIKTRFTRNNDTYFYDVSCDFWAQKCQIISPNSIDNHLLQAPLNPLVAVEHFLSQQKRKDPTIQLLYQVSKEKFENECKVEGEKLEVIKDLCSKATRQFQKILNCLDEGKIDKIEKYAKDGEEFFIRQERKFSGSNREVTPIEETPDISDLSTPASNNQDTTIIKDDFEYIENYKMKPTS